MKKGLKIVLVIIFVVLVLSACAFSYFYFTGKIGNDLNLGNKNSEDKNNLGENSKEAIFELADYPKVDASLATQPLTNAFIKNFTNTDVDVSKLDYTNTHPGYVRLINGEVDLIVVTEPSEEELALAKEKNVELEVIPVVNEGFVFYVNGENKVDNLSLEQVQKIYTGEITNWSQVGGEDAPIRAFQRPENSGSQTGMLSLVMKDLPLMKPLKEDLVETMSAIIGLVSDYDNGKNAIGYSYYYYAKTMYASIDEGIANGIKLLGINGVKPSNQTIKSGEYPLNTAYYIVINKNEPEGSKTRKLVEAMLSERGQAVAESVGYVRVK